MKKMNFDSYFASYTKDNSNQISGFNIKPKIKLLEENIRGNLCDIWLGKDFLDMTQKAQTMEQTLLHWTSSTLKTSAL